MCEDAISRKYTRSKAIETMNQWGRERTPFLFVIDFEMQKILLYRMDKPLPSNVKFSFPRVERNVNATYNYKQGYFRKEPIPFNQYYKVFNEVRRQIISGNSFLLNLTFPTRLETNLTLAGIFENSQSKYRLLIDDTFVCFSPETFVSIHKGKISTYPMKGTIKADIPNASEIILSNLKESAEHYTIVDLLRNDLSLVATDISVERFRYIERIPTGGGNILQVSSEISGVLPADYHEHLGDILFKMLPAGSVTGAPKRKTLEIIREAEPSSRGYYTGVCGHFDGNDLDSAVMIRFIEKRENGDLYFRSGGGITHNSNAESEYQELIDKVYVPFV